MRKNRKIPKKVSVAANVTMYAGMNVLMVFVVTVVYMLASSSCSQLMNEVCKLEEKLGQCENERQREEARWQGLNATENLESTFVKCGISVREPSHNRIIRIGADGKPLSGQLSLKMINERNKNTADIRRYGGR